MKSLTDQWRFQAYLIRDKDAHKTMIRLTSGINFLYHLKVLPDREDKHEKQCSVLYTFKIKLNELEHSNE
jgi:hypothetical protein